MGNNQTQPKNSNLPDDYEPYIGTVFFAFAILFFFILVRSIYNSQQERKLLLEDGVITKGTIHEVRKKPERRSRKNKHSFSYSFRDGKVSESGNGYISPPCKGLRKPDWMYALEGKEFTIIYSKSTPEINRMLIEGADFKDYNIPWSSFADSVYQDYYTNCCQ